LHLTWDQVAPGLRLVLVLLLLLLLLLLQLQPTEAVRRS
jgi:hypothetical protein